MKRCFTSRLLRGLIVGLLLMGIISHAYANHNPLFVGNMPALPLPSTAPAVCELVCPADLIFSLGSGECQAFVTFSVTTTGDCGTSAPVQTAGLPSGSFFPIGVTQNCFSVDLPPLGLPDGDISCCFNVTVLEYPNPTPAITCSDLVMIALDADCQRCINASEILEGGPYRCFDQYVVELDKTVPLGNGPFVPACVGLSDIGKTYQVRITEPQFGNKCWGNVKIEDKTPPVLECRDISIPCNLDPNLNAEPAPAISGYQNLGFTGADVIGDTSSTTPDTLIYTFDYGFLPADAVVLDVNCRIKLSGHSALSDLNILVTAPDGTSASVFTNTSCTDEVWPIDVLFDDEGAGLITLCAQLNANGAAIQGMELGISTPDILSVFDAKNAHGVWTITIIDNIDLNTGIVEIAGLEVSVNAPNSVPTDNCNPVITLTQLDSETPGDCASGIFKTIQRTWTASDASGNQSVCTQNITVLHANLSDVVMPPNYDGIGAASFNCGNIQDPTPEGIETLGLQGFPWIFGRPEGCAIVWSYQDNYLPVCDGTVKIIRDWTVLDFCTGESFEHAQVIKVSDSQGPSFTCPENLTASTDPFACCATVDLPNLIVTDDCSRINSASGTIAIFDPNTGQQTGLQSFSGNLTNFAGNNLANPDTLADFGLSNCLPKGTHTVTYMVEDNCSNTTTCSFQLTIIDNIIPIAACDETSTVAIGLDNPNDCFGPAGPNGVPAALGACRFGGVSWVKAATFDDGSYDVCAGNTLKFTIRRMPPYSDCIQELNSTNGNTPCDDPAQQGTSEYDLAIAESDSIKFYSCEVGSTQSIILRVYQLDTDGNISLDPNGVQMFNECTIQVNVVDKIKPVCVPPPAISVTCEQFDPSLSLYGSAGIFDNCCLDTTSSYQSQCGLTHSANYSNFDSLCNKGTITRIFRAFDCAGNSSSCTQQVVVNFSQNYYVQFPDDVIATECTGSGVYGEPTFFGEDCELLAISYEDEIITVVPDACFKIERNWTVINWCTYDPILPLIMVPNPNPNAIVNHPSNLPGPIVSACGTMPPWSATVVKISPTDPAATDYCSFWDANANGYRYKQHIKIIDTEDPAVENCPSGPVSIADSTQNDPALWHTVFNPTLPEQDLMEASTSLSITSSDDCSGGNLPGISYLLFLDLDNDGTQESVVQSSNVPGADTIRYNNNNTPGLLGGTLVTFDSRTVPNNQKWHFALETTHNGSNTTAAVRWNTAATPNAFVNPQLPAGNHKIRWIVPDFCGNQSVCEYLVNIQATTSAVKTLNSDGFALYQNEPNPFRQNTRIGFYLPDAAEATLSVYDIEGRLLFAQTGNFSQGHNVISITGTGLDAPGMLYYKLESGAHVAWRKMVLIR